MVQRRHYHDDRTRRRHRSNTAMASIALIIAVVALVLAWAAYNRAGVDLGEQAERTVEEDLQGLERSLAVAEARLELLALRSEVAVENVSVDVADDVAEVRADLKEAYAETSGEVRESWREMDASLEELEINIREGSADALASLDRSVTALRGDVAVSEQQECRDEGGQWKEFSDACADNCDAADTCAQVITESCDCGPDRCWNGETCEPAD